jgi:glycosyltransferase involved in cell wall biosynthesis
VTPTGRKHTILLVTEEMIPNVQRFSLTEKLARALSDSGNDVILVCLKGDGEWSHPGARYLPIAMPGWSLFSLTQRIRANLAICFKVLKICFTNKIDLAYGWWPIMFFARFLGFTKMASDMPEFMDVMYVSFNKPFSSIMGAALRVFQNIVARNSEFLLTESETSRNLWAERGVPLSRTQSIPYGVDTKYFAEARKNGFREKYGVSLAETVVFYHGDIGKDDGVDILVKAAAGLPVKVIIAGDGDPAYMKYLHSLPANNIIFTGWVHYSKIASLMAETDIYAAPFRKSPYTDTTCPLKQMEAMAAGKAVIISRLDTFSKYVKDGIDCLLVEPGNESELREAIRKLAGDAGLRKPLGVNAGKTAVNFDWSIRTSKEAALITDFLNGVK